MIEKRDILKMVRNVTRRSQGIPDKRLIHPRREWILGLALFAVITIGGSLYNVFTYKSLEALESGLNANEAQLIRYQESRVLEALEIYRGQRRSFNDLREAINENKAVPVEQDSTDLVDPVAEQEVLPSPEASTEELVIESS